MADLILLLALFFIIYSYFLYPLIIKYLAGRTGELTIDDVPFSCSISIILSVHNEEKHIEERLNNLLQLSKPSEKVEIIVVSDGSSDNTNKILSNYSHDDVKIHILDKNIGKSAAVNVAVTEANHEILVFADVRQRFDQEVLIELSKPFSDPGIGAVTGELIICDKIDEGKNIGHYWSYEKSLRLNESKYDSVIGVTGAIYAARRELFQTIPDGLILDDLYVPMTIIKKGYRVLMVSTAKAYDQPSKNISHELKRKIRTLLGNYQIINALPWLISLRKNPVFFQWFSHKITRLLVPHCLIVIFLASAVSTSLFAKYLFILQICFYSISLLVYMIEKSGYDLGKLSIVYYFIVLNYCAFIAWVRFMTGNYENVWRKG